MTAPAGASRSGVDRARRACAVVLGLLVVGALGWVVLRTPLLGVDRVRVTGEDRVSAAQVVALAAVPLGTPLARVDVEAVRRRVAALPAVREVVVSRSWPSTLRVRVVERRPVAWVAATRGVTLLDRDGVAFDTEPRPPTGAVRLQVPAPGPHDPTTRSALAVLDELPEGLRTRLAIVRAASPEAVSLLLRDGRQVVWGGPGRARDKAVAAEALLRLPGTVYDVTSPDVVVRREAGPSAGVGSAPPG